MSNAPTPEEERLSYDNTLLEWDPETKLGTLTLGSDIYRVRVTTEIVDTEDGEQRETVTSVERLGIANDV